MPASVPKNICNSVKSFTFKLFAFNFVPQQRTFMGQFSLFELNINLDVLFTVKAATLIFISGRGSIISSARQGKSGSIYSLVKNKQVVWAAQMCVHS